MSRQDKALEQFDKEQAISDKRFYGRNVLIGSNLEKFDTLNNVPTIFQKHSKEISKIKKAYKPIKKAMMSESSVYSNGKVLSHK